MIESDFVSGNHAKGYDTPSGAYPLTYKQKDATLKGENYRTPVSYWMPFNGNIGMHDAKWRSSFGGQIYMTNGSHGCVNLPPAVAKVIFQNISTGDPVLCYHLDGTGSKSTSTGTRIPGRDEGCGNNCSSDPGRNDSCSVSTIRDHCASIFSSSRANDCSSTFPTAIFGRKLSGRTASRSGREFTGTVSVRDHSSGEQTIWSGSGSVRDDQGDRTGRVSSGKMKWYLCNRAKLCIIRCNYLVGLRTCCADCKNT